MITIKRDEQQDFIEYCNEKECYDGLTIGIAQKLKDEVCDDETVNWFFDEIAEDYGLPVDSGEVEESELYSFVKENYHRIVAWCKAETKDGSGAEAWDATVDPGLPDRWWESEE